jgi:hypothetical protein
MHLDRDGLWYRPATGGQRTPGDSRLSSRLDGEELHSGNIECLYDMLMTIPSEPDGAHVRMDI